MDRLIEMYKMSLDVIFGRMSYYDYSVKVRKKEYMKPQIICLGVFLTLACLVSGFPIWACLLLFYALITGILMISKAYTIKRQLIMSFLWGLQSFIVGVVVMVLMVYLGKI